MDSLWVTPSPWGPGQAGRANSPGSGPGDNNKQGKEPGTERVSLDDVDGVDDEIVNFPHMRACLALREMTIISTTRL